MEIVQQVSSRLSVGVMEFRKTKSTDCYEKQKDFMMTCLVGWELANVSYGITKIFLYCSIYSMNAYLNTFLIFNTSALTVFSPCLLFFLFKGCNKLSFKNVPVSSRMNPFYVSVTVT